MPNAVLEFPTSVSLSAENLLIASGDHTFMLRGDQDGGGVLDLFAPQWEDDIWEAHDGTVTAPPGFPRELTDSIIDCLVSDCLLGRDYDSAREYIGTTRRSLVTWYRELVGASARVEHGALHRFAVPRLTKMMFGEVGGLLKLVGSLYDRYDEQVVFRNERQPTLSIEQMTTFGLQTRKCQRWFVDRSMYPHDFTYLKISPGDGMETHVERRCPVSMTPMDVEDVVVGHFLDGENDGTGVLSWAGQRACDAMLHQGFVDARGLINTTKSLFPSMLIALRRQRGSCECCEVRRPDASWMGAAEAWEKMARLVRLTFGFNVEVLVHAPWDAGGLGRHVDVQKRPMLATGGFVRPRDVREGRFDISIIGSH